MSASSDPPLDALMFPFREGRIAHAADTLFLNARAGAALPAIAAQWQCEQAFKPWADRLEQAGCQVVDVAGAARHARVLLLLPRQRDLARAWMARGVASLADDGVLVASQSNDAGARSAQADLARLVSPLDVHSKHHCRVLVSLPGARAIDEALVREWSEGLAAQPVPGTRMSSRPGVFAWDRVDAGSALLAAHLPQDLSGAAADLGAGWGYLSAALLERCPGIASLDLFEADAHALGLARHNLAEARVPCRFHWHDVAAGIPGRYDVIVSNPPFHDPRVEDAGIGRAFLRAAADALRPGGRLWLVANRHLPYERTLAADFTDVHVRADADGYKVIEAGKGA